MNTHFSSKGCLVLLLAWAAPQPAAEAMFDYPEIETVPTARLIANLEQRLASQGEESDKYRAGEEIRIWFWRRPTLAGTYTIDTNGCIQLPEVGQLKVAGRTPEDLTREMNPTRDANGFHVGQRWDQRKGRLLPGERAELQYELARVYSIAYAQKPQRFQALRGGDRPFLGSGASRDLPPDRRRFRAAGPVPRTPQIEMTPEQARTNLAAAVSHFRLALELQTNHLAAQIGLAWCLDQQGEKGEARRAYERALNLAWEKEKAQDHILETSYVQEIIGYLKPLLDPEKDAEELTRLQTYSETISHKGRAMTPILFALDAGRSFAELVDPTARVTFDLDGSGLPRRWGWISPRAAWLVFDPQRRGKITSGLQLFGNVTFWVLWRNGYEALSSLDDNDDGMLTGAELEGLAAWQDVNGNGVSDPGEVTPLRKLGVMALSTDACTGADGLLQNPHGLWLHDGSTRPTFDWVTRCHEEGGQNKTGPK